MNGSYWEKATSNRVSRRRALAFGGGALGAAALLAACGGGSSSSSSGTGAAAKSGLISAAQDTSKQAKIGGLLKYWNAADVASFDIHVLGTPLITPHYLVYNHLTRIKPGYMTPTEGIAEPDISTAFEFSPDRLQLTFKIRQGVTWHNIAPVNGRALDIDDILFSWNRFAEKGAGRAQVANSASPDAPVLSFTAPDKSTIVVKTSTPVSYLPQIFANALNGYITIIPKEAGGGFDLRNKAIGTGAFFMSDYQPSVGFHFKRNPNFFEKAPPWLEEIDLPIVSDYANALAQLKAGNIHTYTPKPDDVLGIKREQQTLNLFQTDLVSGGSGSNVSFGWLPAGKSPFLDIRVRQAYSMAIDRDLFVDTFSNAASFRSQGLPIELGWNTILGTGSVGWLDPKGKDFGPNAKYYQYDVAEAKKLMAAAGYPTGFEVISTRISGTQYGTDYEKRAQVLEGMHADIGLKFKPNLVDYATDFPKWKDGSGMYEGLAYKAGLPSPANDPVSSLVGSNYSKSGIGFYGYDVNGKGDGAGDPFVDDLVLKLRAEIDPDKRKAGLYDLQRYLAKQMYYVAGVGGATGFDVAWPAVGNFNVFRPSTANWRPYWWWLDDTKAPVKPA